MQSSKKWSYFFLLGILKAGPCPPHLRPGPVWPGLAAGSLRPSRMPRRMCWNSQTGLQEPARPGEADLHSYQVAASQSAAMLPCDHSELHAPHFHPLHGSPHPVYVVCHVFSPKALQAVVDSNNLLHRGRCQGDAQGPSQTQLLSKEAAQFPRSSHPFLTPVT